MPTAAAAVLGGSLAGKTQQKITVWVQIPPLQKLVHTSQFWFIFEHAQSCHTPFIHSFIHSFMILPRLLGIRPGQGAT